MISWHSGLAAGVHSVLELQSEDIGILHDETETHRLTGERTEITRSDPLDGAFETIAHDELALLHGETGQPSK